MNRRRYLRLGAAGVGLLAGCVGRQADDGAEADLEAVHVAPDGDDGASGTGADPVASIQAAIERAEPGWTVRVAPGHYYETVETVRAGAPGAPITVTGPAEAVLHGEQDVEWAAGFVVRHSHVHLTGLTLDGLRRPEAPDDPRSYANLNYYTPYPEREHYLEDLVVKPHAVGNVRQAAVKLGKANDVEIGEFRVVGPAGLQHLLGDATGHNGEIVYVGTAPDAFGGPGPNVPGVIDESSGYHVHHVDNSAGHEHAELVDVKAGTTDVTIEYCTDAGGAAQYLLPGADVTDEAAIHVGGNDVTLRWCVVEGSRGQAVEVGSWGPAHPDRFEEEAGFPLPEEYLDTGRDNAIYGNRLADSGGLAVRYPTVNGEIAERFGPDDQVAVCGNEVTGPTHGDPAASCPEDVPAGDGIGHTGGTSRLGG